MNCAEQKTAKIYAFPPRGRFAGLTDQISQLEREAQRYPSTDFGSSWYHEAEIAKSAKQPR